MVRLLVEIASRNGLFRDLSRGSFSYNELVI